MIQEILATGRENARTGKELALLFGCDARDISRAIEKERQEGAPICAATGEKPGYFLPANAEELEIYCNQLKHRGMAIFKTRQALIKILKAYRDKQGGSVAHGK